LGAIILGSVLGSAAVSATRNAPRVFRYYIPALPLWYRAFFVVFPMFAAVASRNVALRAAFLLIAVSQVLRVSLIGLSIDWAIIAVLFMIAGITLETSESRWTRRPVLLVIAVVLASALWSFTAQTYSLRVFDRLRDCGSSQAGRGD